MTAVPGAIVVLDPLAVQVSRPMILLRLGYRRPQQVPERTARLIDEVIAKGQGLLAARAAYRLIDVRPAPEPGIVLLGGTMRAVSASLTERLADCRRAVLFAGTVGPALDAWVHELSEAGELTRALLADAYASAAAIALGLEIERIAAARLADEGLRPTKRFAPGYADWALADQAPLHALLDSVRIGIRLTEEFLMLPAKSISGVIGGR